MKHTFLIKIYHSFDKGRSSLSDFLSDVQKKLHDGGLTFGLHYSGGEFFYSVTVDSSAYEAFETQFYTDFPDFQLVPDTKGVWQFDQNNTIVGEVGLKNQWFYPFRMNGKEDTDFVFNIFRTFENLNIATDRMGFFVETKPVHEASVSFFIRSKLQFLWLRIRLVFSFFRYLLNYKIQKDWKKEGKEFFKNKIEKELFDTKIFIVCTSSSKESASAKVKTLFNNFLIFENYPLNEFYLTLHPYVPKNVISIGWSPEIRNYVFSSEEIAAIYHFPHDPKRETALLKSTAKKLPLPIGMPILPYTMSSKGETVVKSVPAGMNVLGISDYRSTKVPVGIFDDDRVRHVYIIGKTGVGKSKAIVNLARNDILQGRGFGIIDPHGDIVEEIMMHIPIERKDDVIIFDPTDDKYPFCLNPLDVKETESKQILAKGFIDIFKKFFGANWNPKLEHVLRMVFLGLLDKPGSTLFDIVRALTDKDFRYEMIAAIDDDVVKNFWTNEFAGWSQQFNTEAIMPILNKVGQILSIDMLKNIFASTENKLDFRAMMDEKKILFVKLPKGKLQEEIMGFLGAMFVTKIYQAAMGRQSMKKSDRTPFFLYVDEFQNFATDTFGEILSEARKYGLGLTVAHQFIKQIPHGISDALFGNVGTLISFRISSEDALYMKQHFDPFVGAYDLANLNVREFYCKTLVEGQVKDPFSLRTPFMPDPDRNPELISTLYETSRARYSRPLIAAKKELENKQSDVVHRIEEFSAPII